MPGSSYYHLSDGIMICDICSKAVKVTPTVKATVEREALIVLCRTCWERKGMSRDRYSGQIQGMYYLGN